MTQIAIEEMTQMTMAGDTWKPHVALSIVMLNYGFYHVLTKVALSGGINQLVFCVLRDLVALSILGPLAYFLEKRTRPPLSSYLLFSYIFLGLTGIFGNQLLFTLGLNLTSPSYAAAMQPAIPVFTFLLALLLRIETVHWRRMDGKAKVGGVVICITGASVMALYKGPALIGVGISGGLQGLAIAGKPAPEPVGWLSNALVDMGIDLWHVGVLCLIGNSLCMAMYILYQSRVLTSYPASLSLTAYSYFFGASLMALTGCFFANEPSDWILSSSEIFAVLFAGIVASALNYGLLTYSNRMLGPSLVALYMPLQPVASSILSQIFLGSSLHVGRSGWLVASVVLVIGSILSLRSNLSAIGGVLIVAGLYTVTWGRQEGERYMLSSHHRLPSIPAYSDQETWTITDPLLQVLNHRGPPNSTNPV